MKQIRLLSIADSYFPEAWKIYTEAFPPNERRLIEPQEKLMENSDYHFDVLVVDNEVTGFVLWFDLEKVRYIDHFATAKKHRNKGFGKLILEKFITNSDKSILLEVELPESEINERRINFYKRIGFKLNTHHYQLPVFVEGEPPLQLLLMTYPEPITKKEVDEFVQNCHPIIFSD